MNEVVREFLLETHENVAQLDLDLVALEQNPGQKETIARVFRTLHTVKGTAGFLGLEKLQGVAHAAENLLTRVRSGEIAFGPPIASAMLAVVDAVRAIMTWIETAESEGDGDYSLLIARLERLAKGEVEPAAPEPQVEPAPQPIAAVSTPPPLPTPVATATPVPAPAPPPVAEVEPEVAPPPKPAPAIAASEAAEPEPVDARAATVADTAIRVDVDLLDKLMNVVGELVLARNQIMQLTASMEGSPLAGAVARLNLLTTELQAGVMKTRMQPIATIWSKFPRLVRDLAVACGKQVRFEMEGQETELDKTILEAIRDPLTHMVRNAVDHGFESPKERVARGKHAEGRLKLRAFHEGGKVVVVISDDGGGIDPNRVREKAVRNGLITSEQASKLTEREVLELVFRPGFSTADRVTQFSGRGVGMDVVRTNVERIGGSVDLESSPGAGTAVRMQIPLTLAIIPALTVSAAGERFAIPQVGLLELVHLDSEAVQKRMERIHDAPVFRLRGNLLPLVHLAKELQLEYADGARTGDTATIVVLQADDRQFGLVVDAIHDTEEIVVKPLQQQLKGLRIYSGAAIMGDGRVALILDVLGLAQRANVLSGRQQRTRAESTPAASQAAAEQSELLVFTPDGVGRMAIPLDRVARLEEFPRSAVERCGANEVVQYRGEILPLVHVSSLLGGDATGSREERENVQVVVHSRGGRSVGLVVERMLDVVHEAVSLRAPSTRPGVLFNAVVQGRVTEFLDLDQTLAAADRMAEAKL